MGPVDLRIAAWAQMLMHRRSRYKVIYGGRGSGKSWNISRVLLLLAMKMRLKVLCAREFQLSISDSVHALLSEQIEAMGIPGWSVGKTEIVFGPTGSSFHFVGLWQNVQKIQSFEGCHICWVEEAQRVSAESWKVLTPTIRTRPLAGWPAEWPQSEIWVSFNPTEEDDPTAMKFLKHPPTGTMLVKVNWEHNPWCPSELRQEAEDLRKNDPEEYANVWGGEFWTRSDAQVFSKKWSVEPFEPGGEGWLGPFNGIDFGFSTTPLVAGQQWVYQNRLYVEKAVGGLRIETGAIPALLEEHFREARTLTFRADCARPETISQLSNDGYAVYPCEKWSGSVEDGVSFMRSFDRIVIHPQARIAEEQIRKYKYRQDKNGNVCRDIVKKHDDWADQCRYAIEPLVKAKLGSMNDLV